MSTSAPDPHRDERGRFLPGNPGGPGNPNVRRLARQARLIREAVSDDDLDRVVRRLVELAQTGDANAARLVLERIAGKPSDAPEEPVSLDLVDVRSLADLAENARRIATAAALGEITTEQADRLLRVFQVVGETLERADLERRVEALETSSCG